MIRHAPLFPALTISVLTVAMVGAAFRALLISAVGFAVLTPLGLVTTEAAAVGMAAKTAFADVEDRPAFGEDANLKQKNNFVEIRHGFGQAELDKGRLSVAR